MSRALQSLTSATPKTWSRNALAGTGSPSLLPTPTTKPSSSSKSSRRLGPKRGSGSSGAFDWPARPHDGVPLDDDGPAPAVVADGEVPPVREQRLGVGPEEPAEVRRVLERRVEVDVVARPRTGGATVVSSSGTRFAPPSTSSPTRATTSSQAAARGRGTRSGSARRRRRRARPPSGRGRRGRRGTRPEAGRPRPRRRRSRRRRSQRQDSERLELLDRLEEAAAPDRVQALAPRVRELARRLRAVRASGSRPRSSVNASGSDSSSAPPPRRTRPPRAGSGSRALRRAGPRDGARRWP